MPFLDIFIMCNINFNLNYNKFQSLKYRMFNIFLLERTTHSTSSTITIEFLLLKLKKKIHKYPKMR